MFNVFNLFIALSPSYTGCLKVCGKFTENLECTTTKRSREEGKSAGPMAAELDACDVDGWGLDG